MLLISKDAIFLFRLGRSGGGSVCPFTARRAGARSPEFLEERRRRWLGPGERDGADGSGEARSALRGRGTAARASAGMQRAAWQTAGTRRLPKFLLGTRSVPVTAMKSLSLLLPRTVHLPLTASGKPRRPRAAASAPTPRPLSALPLFSWKSPGLGVFHPPGFAPPQELPAHSRSSD